MQAQYKNEPEINEGPRHRILEIMNEWITKGDGASDLLDDVDFYSAWNQFLSNIMEPPLSLPQEDGLRNQATALRNLTKSMLEFPHPLSLTSASPQPLQSKFGAVSPDLVSVNPVDLVDNMDEMATFFLSQVTESDVMTASDVLEVQMADRSLVPNKDVGTAPEEVAPETIFTFLNFLEPSPLVSAFCGRSQLWKCLPRSIGKLIEVHNTLRRWITAYLAAPGVGPRVREERIDVIIQAIEYCRARTLNSLASPIAPSFVEAILTEALWTPECRIFGRAWQNVATTRNVPVDSMVALFPRINATRLPPRRRDRAVDSGWLIERLFEVLALPDTLAHEGHILVNYDKRRCVFLFVMIDFLHIS